MFNTKKSIQLMRSYLMILAFFNLIFITGCASIAVGGGAKIGTAAYQERGIQGVASDMATTIRMRAKLVKADENFGIGVSVDVFEGRMLLTGTLPDKEMQAKVVSMAWKTDGVKDVINEIQTGITSLRDLGKDTWASTLLHSKITFDKKIHAINYSIETVNGIIYMIGIAQNKIELDRVIEHAKNINYIKRIINYVRIKKDAI